MSQTLSGRYVVNLRRLLQVGVRSHCLVLVQAKPAWVIGLLQLLSLLHLKHLVTHEACLNECYSCLLRTGRRHSRPSLFQIHRENSVNLKLKSSLWVVRYLEVV
jgi:hypothetical protein